jgi:hypothetical protein
MEHKGLKPDHIATEFEQATESKGLQGLDAAGLKKFCDDAAKSMAVDAPAQGRGR